MISGFEDSRNQHLNPWAGRVRDGSFLFFFFLFLKDSTNLNEGQETFLSIRNLTAHTFSWKNQRRNAVLLLVLGNNERHLAEDELGTTGPQTSQEIVKPRPGEETQGCPKPGKGGFGGRGGTSPCPQSSSPQPCCVNSIFFFF